ncbi:MAG: aminoglycoside 6-adenylyltransferase [Thermoanaerobaculia bacterium]
MHSNYHAFTAQLVSTLTSDPRILGLVALGSMAERSRTPDAFSDHDFFVIAHDAETFRTTTEWLPERERIALWFRETPHGCKAVYDDGHLVEYAVFTPDELRLARANDYRVLLDRERIEERMMEIATLRDAPPSPEWLHGMFLSNLLVATARARRGELFSARWMLQHAARHLIPLLGGGGDDLDPLRRFQHYALEQALRLGPASAARDMLAIYEKECGGDPRAISAVRASFPFAP